MTSSQKIKRMQQNNILIAHLNNDAFKFMTSIKEMYYYLVKHFFTKKKKSRLRIILFLEYAFSHRHLNQPEICKLLFGRCLLFEALSVIEFNMSHFGLCAETGRFLTSTQLEYNFTPRRGRRSFVHGQPQEALEYQ